MLARLNQAESLFNRLKAGRKLAAPGGARTRVRDKDSVDALISLALLSMTALTVVDQRQQHATHPSTSPPRPRRTTATRRPAAPAIPVAAGPTARRNGDKVSTASHSTSGSKRRRGHLSLIADGRA
jgi:hypothetical protein